MVESYQKVLENTKKDCEQDLKLLETIRLKALEDPFHFIKNIKNKVFQFIFQDLFFFPPKRSIPELPEIDFDTLSKFSF